MKYWYKFHCYTGLLCAVFFLLLCVSALPLIFKQELRQWNLNTAVQATRPASLLEVPFTAMTNELTRKYPGSQIKTLYLNWEQGLAMFSLSRPAQAAAEHEPFITFHMNSGQTVEQNSGGYKLAVLPDFMRVMSRLHVQLQLGKWGRYFLGFICGVTLLCSISGLYLYHRLTKRLPFGAIRRNSRRLFWLDWHKLLGLVTLAWAALLCYSGLVLVFVNPYLSQWEADRRSEILAVYRQQATAAVSAADAPLTFDQIIERTAQIAPDHTVRQITLHTAPGSPVCYEVAVAGQEFGTYLRRPLFLDAGGAIIAEPDYPWTIQLLRLAGPLHFDNHNTWPLKSLWLLMGILTCLMTISGVYAWWLKGQATDPARRTSSMPRPMSAAPATNQTFRQIWLIPGLMTGCGVFGLVAPLAGRAWEPSAALALAVPVAAALWYWRRSKT